MSMYNVMRGGTHPLAHLLLPLLGLTQDNFTSIERFRDIMLFQDEIRILTRTGGGNREDYKEGNNFLKTLTGFLRDWDDPFDSTYAWWAYKWPKREREGLQEGINKLREIRPDLLLEDLEKITNHTIKRMKQST